MSDDKNKRNFKVQNNLFFEIITDDLKNGKSVKFNVSGKSMVPFLNHGDQVVVKQPSDLDVKKGDILLFKYQGKFILHRLVKIKGPKYYLAGDGNLDQIEIIEKEDVIGMVTGGSRGDKLLKVSSNFNKKLGLMWYYIRPLRYLFSKFKKV